MKSVHKFGSMLLLALAACDAAEQSTTPAEATATDARRTPEPINSEDANETAAFSGIAASETVHFTGTEPFWGGRVAASALTYSTPEVPDGTDIAVARFAGKGGVSWNGTYSGARFVLAVTPGDCSDGMSDRSYPFVATLEVAGEQRSGCAWTDRQPFSGPANP